MLSDHTTFVQRIQRNLSALNPVHRNAIGPDVFASGGREIAVHYGGVHVPGRHESASGGIIKLQDLQCRFANTARDANLLYLVSSALPSPAPVLVSRWLPHPALQMVQAARRAGARVVLNQNGVAYPAWFGPGWKRENRTNAALLRLADHVIYQSAFAKQTSDQFAWRRDHNWSVLPNPVNTATFAFEPRVRKDILVVLVAGSFDQKYRLDAALQALRTVRALGCEARMVIAGLMKWDAPDRAVHQLQEAVDALGLKPYVTFYGAYRQLEAPELFGAADIFLHTTVNDVCPRVVVEAMSSGLPVVFAQSGGVGELVGTAAGVGVDVPANFDTLQPPDGAALGAALKTVADSLEQYSYAARSRACEALDVEHWLDAHGRLFCELIQKRGTA